MRASRIVPLVLALVLASCGYGGDGKYSAFGIWPFVDYSLQLPTFVLMTGKTIDFDLEGFQPRNGESTWLQVSLESDILRSFHDLDAHLKLTFLDGDQVIFEKNSALNAHYQRMVVAGDASLPLEGEWNGRYLFKGPNMNNQVVAFHRAIEPMDVWSVDFNHKLPEHSQDIRMLVEVSNVPDGWESVNVKIGLFSGWK